MQILGESMTTARAIDLGRQTTPLTNAGSDVCMRGPYLERLRRLTVGEFRHGMPARRGMGGRQKKQGCQGRQTSTQQCRPRRTFCNDTMDCIRRQWSEPTDLHDDNATAVECIWTMRAKTDMGTMAASSPRQQAYAMQTPDLGIMGRSRSQR